MFLIKPDPPNNIVNALNKYPPLVVKLLHQRGIKSKIAADKFINPRYKDFHNPFLIKGMKEAVGVIREAVKNKKKISVVSDYDTDGTTSAVVMTEIFFNLGHENFFTYIPNRFVNGVYGITPSITKNIIEDGSSLVIIMDCGMSSDKEIKKLLKSGIEVLVIDHHQKSAALPKGVVLVNPTQLGEKYPFKKLSSCGLMLKLSHAILGEIRQEFIEFAALASMGDKVSLEDENRTITRLGFESILSTKNPGLQELVKHYGDDLDKLADVINCAVVSGDSNNSYQLLLTHNKGIAGKIAKTLIIEYKKRQKQLLEATKIAKKMASEQHHRKILFLGHRKFYPYIKGLIANNVLKIFKKPVIIYQPVDNVIHGSARGLEGVNLVNILHSCRKYLNKYGGHPKAAGLSFHINNLNKVRKCIIEQEGKVNLNYSDHLVEVDVLVENINREALDIINKFKPYGMKNPPPLLLFNLGMTAEELQNRNSNL